MVSQVYAPHQSNYRLMGSPGNINEYQSVERERQREKDIILIFEASEKNKGKCFGD